MTSVKKVKKSVKIDPSIYINCETGESLYDEMDGNSELELSKNSNVVTINSNDFTIIDSSAIAFLKQHLNRSELGSIGIMAEDLKTALNLVYNHNRAHSNESLQKSLGIASNSTFRLLIKKLMSLGVLYQIKGRIGNGIRVMYIMNPFVARKRKQVDKMLVEVFEQFKINEIKN